jgi:hypothetical protein
MSVHIRYKAKIQFSALTIGILEHWHDGIIFPTKGKKPKALWASLQLTAKL